MHQHADQSFNASQQQKGLKKRRIVVILFNFDHLGFLNAQPRLGTWVVLCGALIRAEQHHAIATEPVSAGQSPRVQWTQIGWCSLIDANLSVLLRLYIYSCVSLQIM